MTRPALIIGLGGTGQWVLTYLKKDLIESNNGQMPDNVSLLCFDTMPQAGTQLATASIGRRGEKEVKVGSIQLIKDKEFVHLGGDVYDLSQAICADSKKESQSAQRLPHLTSWFRACHWLENLPRAAFVLSAGAGQLRQFGRIALFNDLSSSMDSAVWKRLDAAIGQLAPNLQEQRLEIIIVGSFAGGTGSGLFIDIALLARHRARNISNLIRGYFVLPRAFDPDADDDMLARSFAAWRELNRFMVVSQDFALPNLIYNSKDRALQLGSIRSKAFDACYLIDGVRGGARIAAEAELGVHPSIADAISAILDNEAGGKYTEWVVQNLAPKYATMPGIPLYSAVGTHTYKVPVYYIQQDFAHKLTRRWLDVLLKPIRDDQQNPDRVTRVDSTSPNDSRKIGREEAITLFTSPREFNGQSEAPTLFYSRIAELASTDGADDPALVEDYAKGSWGGRAWLDAFTNLGDRKDILDLVARVRQEANLRLSNVIKPSKAVDEPSVNFPKRVDRMLGPLVQEHYGFRKIGGEEDRGKFGDTLGECSQAQVTIFCHLVNLWLMRTLMDGDKSGRLGYTHDLLDGTIGHLTNFLTFMEKVKAKREELRPFLRVQEAREKAKKSMLGFSGKKWPPFLPITDHPRVHDTQVAYLNAEQAVVDTRKDEILHNYVTSTASQMQQYCTEVRAELERWIRLLATGDSATGIEGLYSLLESQRRDIERTRKADERLTAVQTSLGELTYPQNLEQAELKRLIDGVTWRIDGRSSGFHLTFSVEPQGEPPAKLEMPSGQERIEARRELVERNLSALQTYAIRRFSELPEETRVAEKIRKEYTAKDFSNTLGNKAEPLFDKMPAQEGSAAKKAELIRISTEGVDLATQYFVEGQIDPNDRTKVLKEGLVQERRQNRGLAPNTRDQDWLIEAVGSADQHKCTIVRTDDLMPVELFRTWDDCMQAYLRNREMRPEFNHNFPAESNAANYEIKLSEKKRKTYRVFHPWVVMLLEHPDRLEQFFLCWALGWLRVQNDGAQTWYELNVPGFDRPFMLTPRSASLWSTFQAARYFVLEGLDQSRNSAWTLDYDEIRTALETEERQSGSDEWLASLRDQIADLPDASLFPDRIVVYWLHNHIKELENRKKASKDLPPGEPVDFRQAYTDLADVAALMFEERIDRKETQLGRSSRPRPIPPASLTNLAP